MDAFELAISGVLVQDGHPIAYERRKLNDTEWRYTVQEKEMTSGALSKDIEALCTWL